MACRNASEDGQAGRAVDGIGQGSSRVHARAGGIGKRVLPGKILAGSMQTGGPG